MWDKEKLAQIKKSRERWEAGPLMDELGRSPEREMFSELPRKGIYTPEDLADLDYPRDLGFPGEYPYTRGVHRDMFRGRLWTRREVCGFGSGKDTNARLRFQMREGASGLSVILDNPGSLVIDPDHPMAREAVGVQGASICHLGDMIDLLEGIPIEKISLACDYSLDCFTEFFRQDFHRSNFINHN